MGKKGLRAGVSAIACITLLGGCATTSQTGNLMRAKNRLDSGDPSGALELANFILGSPPANPEIGAQASLLKGLSLEALGRFIEAACVYRFTYTRYSESVTAAQAEGRYRQLPVDCEE